MLRHMEGLGQMYDKTRYTKKIIRKSYNKMYDTSLAVVRQHQARMQ